MLASGCGTAIAIVNTQQLWLHKTFKHAQKTWKWEGDELGKRRGSAEMGGDKE